MKYKGIWKEHGGSWIVFDGFGVEYGWDVHRMGMEYKRNMQGICRETGRNIGVMWKDFRTNMAYYGWSMVETWWNMGGL